MKRVFFVVVFLLLFLSFVFFMIFWCFSDLNVMNASTFVAVVDISICVILCCCFLSLWCYWAGCLLVLNIISQEINYLLINELLRLNHEIWQKIATKIDIYWIQTLLLRFRLIFPWLCWISSRTEHLWEHLRATFMFSFSYTRPSLCKVVTDFLNLAI